MHIRVALGPHLHFNPTSADGQGSLEPHGAIFSRFSAEYQDYIKKFAITHSAHVSTVARRKHKLFDRRNEMPLRGV